MFRTAMLLLEAKKLLFSCAATYSPDRRRRYELEFLDVKKAYLYAPVRRDVYVRFPPRGRRTENVETRKRGKKTREGGRGAQGRA